MVCRLTRANLLRFIRYDIPAAWSETTNSLDRLQHDIQKLLGEKYLVPEDSFVPSWFESCNDDSLHDPTLPSDPPADEQVLPNPSYSVDTSFHSPDKDASSKPTRPSWRYRRWLSRTLKKLDHDQASPAVPLYVPSAPPVPKHHESDSPPPAPNWIRLFLRTFNPAVAGISLLDAERYNHHRPSQFEAFTPKASTTDDSATIEYASVHLRDCANSILTSIQSNQVLPRYFANVHEVVGSVYQAVVNPKSTPLIVDTGASCCITPHKSDFVDGTYTTSEVKIKDLSGLNSVAGKGLIRWRVRDTKGRIQTLEIEGYHIPKASVRLMSPQSVIKSLGGSGGINHLHVALHMTDDVTLVAPYNYANLPILPLVDTVATPAGFWNECFGFNSEMREAWARGTLDAKNQNLSLAQKEILL